MAFALSTDLVLDAYRTAIGTSIAVDGLEFNWKYQIEGDPMRFIGDSLDYPILVHKVEDTKAERESTSLIPFDLSIQTTVVVYASETTKVLSPTAYKTIRRIGEALVSKVMNEGTNFGTAWLRRYYRSSGVDYGLTSYWADHGLLFYQMVFGFQYFENEVGYK